MQARTINIWCHACVDVESKDRLKCSVYTCAKSSRESNLYPFNSSAGMAEYLWEAQEADGTECLACAWANSTGRAPSNKQPRKSSSKAGVVPRLAS